jgi:hypothetical protein
VPTDVSEELASILHTCWFLAGIIFLTLKIEAIYSSETSVCFKIAMRDVQICVCLVFETYVYTQARAYVQTYPAIFVIVLLTAITGMEVFTLECISLEKCEGSSWLILLAEDKRGQAKVILYECG